MLIAYEGSNPVFFHKEDIARIERLDPVLRSSTGCHVPAVRVVLNDLQYVYFLDDSDARSALSDVLIECMSLPEMRKYFPEVFTEG